MEKNYKKVGTIDLSKNAEENGITQVMVSDPCYNSDNVYNRLYEVLSGNYNCLISKEKFHLWGVRVRSMAILHTDFEFDFLNKGGYFKGQVAVDSGTMSICDYTYYDKHHINDKDENELDEEWYDKNVCAWCSRKNYHIANKLGFISTSGFGDGVYEVYTYSHNENIVGIEVVFIENDDEDNE